jgi:hypothetical protein
MACTQVLRESSISSTSGAGAMSTTADEEWGTAAPSWSASARGSFSISSASLACEPSSPPTASPTGDARGAREDANQAPGDGSLRPPLRNVVALIDVEIVPGEHSAQQQAPIVVAFDEADLVHPRGICRAVLRDRISGHRGAISGELDHCEVRAS